MKKTLKKYFIPHAGNNYHPHILHTKRAVLYTAVMIALKGIVIGFVLLLPSAVFVLPDILTQQQTKIVELTNELRVQKGLPKLSLVQPLNFSSDLKAVDMATKGYFSHTNPEGHKLAYFLNQVGYKYSVAGENLALGFSSGEDVVDAWIKSPTHYANLIDKDFKEIGVGVETGEYEGQPTVFVAEHFGTPTTLAAVASEPVVNVGKADEITVKDDNATTIDKKVAGVQISEPIELAVAPVAPAVSKIIYNHEDSKVYWEEKNKATTLTVEASITGPVASAVVDVNGYPIELKTDGNNSYFGSLTVQKPAENFFKIIIAPTITIVGKDNKVIKDSIDWDHVKIVSPTPIQKYIYARNWMGNMFSIFSVSRGIYLGFLIFFTTALLINILVKIKKQHHHVIFQTLLLIGLIACLFVV